MARETAAQKREREAQAQATIDGAWEITVGGKAPDAEKVKLMGGAVGFDEPDGGWKKGSVYKIELLVRNIGPDIQDRIDSNTQQPVGTNRTHRLKIMDGKLVEDVTDELARLQAVEGGGEGGNAPGPGPSAAGEPEDGEG